MKIQLLYFQGCPNIDAARAALREAMRAENLDGVIEEIDVESPDAPPAVRGWGSPTILIDGTDITGASRANGSACRLYAGGAPPVADIRARLVDARSVPPASSSRTALPMFGAIAAALAASACCVIPAALAVVGLSGAGFGAALAPYRWFFLGATVVALAVGFWLVYRRQKDACGCEVPRRRRSARVALWISSAVALSLAVYPMIGDGIASTGSINAPAKATLRLKITGMDCPECTDTIAARIQKVPGVVSATVDYKSGFATVRHDDRPGVSDAALAAVKGAGFSAKVAP